MLFIDAVRGFPEASLFMGLIIVAKPISCMVSEVGAPVLALLPLSSCVNALHSGPDSCDFSDTTNPHLPQNFSPVVLSVNISFFPHRAQVSPDFEFTLTMNFRLYLVFIVIITRMFVALFTPVI